MKTIRRLCNAVLCMISITFGICTNTRRLTNKGTQFTLGFMSNVPDADYPVYLRLFITTQEKYDVNVTITTPLFDPAYQKNLSVRSGQVKEVTLNSTLQAFFGVENKGIYVESDGEVTVYASNARRAIMDDFLILPHSVLGSEYYVMSWSGNRASFMVVATQDFTNLNITLGRASQSLSSLGSTINAGESTSVIMRKFETFYVQTTGGDFTGTHIHGNTTFAVFGGSACGIVGQGACDHLAEQMLPVDKWGKEFVTISMPGCASADWFKLVTGSDNTIVNISGISAHTLAKPGDFYNFTLQDSSFRRVSSNKPISLFMFSSGSCGTTYNGDPSMLMIPALSQYSSNVIFGTNSSDKTYLENYVAIVINETFKNGLRLDDSVLASVNWFSINGLKSHVYTEVKVSGDFHSISHLNCTVKFLAFAAGIQKDISYSYLLGLDFLSNNDSCTDIVIGKDKNYWFKIYYLNIMFM